MKTTLPIMMFALAAMSLSQAQVQSPYVSASEPVSQHDDDRAPPPEPRHIALYMSPAEVMVAMQGVPDEKLSPSLWVYYGFQTQSDPALRRFDTLVVFFSPEQVYKYRVVERKALRELLADIRKTPNPSQPEMISEWPVGSRLDEAVPMTPPRRIGLAMNAEDVTRAMRGNPDAFLAPDIWVYWNFHVAGPPGPKDPDTLVVFFSQGRVSHYKLVRRQAVLPWMDGHAT